ncbi:MAG: hypothetical protein GXP45_03310 [bacterium]|nr:hypothetical protein [bacterium]
MTEKNLPLLGDTATVNIPIQAKKIILPLNIVTALDDNKGFIYILNGS